MAVELQRNQHKRRKDENNNKDPLKKKSKRSTELKELALQEVTSLNNEIRHLEEEIFQRDSLCADTYTLESLEKIETELLTCDLSSSSKEDDRSELEKDIDVLNERLNSLEKLTGIRFVENSSKVLSRTDSTTVLLRQMSGTCQRIPFAVEFEVKEDEKKDSSFRSDNKDAECMEDSFVELTRLQVSVTDPLAEQELNDFLKTVEEEKALQPFFTGLIQYAEWHSNRQRTFDHFKTKYPDIVHLTSASTVSQSLKLHNRNKPGLVFTVLWRLLTSTSGHVLPDFQIHASAPLKHTEQRDKYALLRSVPQQFQKVLPILGIEQAVELVVGMLCR